MRARARRLRSKQPLGMVIVDYLQLMEASGSRRREANRQQEISDITRALKAMAKELNVPVVALSQLSRSPERREDKRPQLADPRESGRLRHHIPIGEHSDRAQRVSPNILAAWGDLRRKNGELLKDCYIQLSGNPPIFNDPGRFLKWLRQQKPEFVHANNVTDGT